MQVKYLYIVTLGDDQELEAAAQTLAWKYKQTKYASTLLVVHLPCSMTFNGTGLEFQGKRKLLKGNNTVTIPENTNAHEVGVYLMFHFSSLMIESYSKRTGENQSEPFTTVKSMGLVLGEGFGQTMQTELKKVPIGKVSLLTCDGADECFNPMIKVQGYEEGDSLAKWFAFGLKEVFAKSCTPPLVAAWDDFITIAADENLTLYGTGFNKREFWGRKVTTGEGTTRKEKGKILGNSEAGHRRKWIWVWNSGTQEYEKKSVVGSGWSVLKTNSLSAIIENNNNN